MILEGKRLLITGVITKDSIAYHAAEQAQREGAEVLLTSFGRVRRMTERAAKRLPVEAEVLELDVNRDEDLAALTDTLQARWGSVDGALHAIAFAPEDALGGRFMTAPADSAAAAFTTSAFSYKSLAAALQPLMKSGSSLVGLDFDATVAWPIYDWMGVCKAGLEATVRYLARDLGPKRIRVNALAAGPLSTMAAKSIPGFAALERLWGKQAPLGWNAKDHHRDVARSAVALLSDWFPSTTGEMVHVDGGYHAIGAAPIDVEAEKNGR